MERLDLAVLTNEWIGLHLSNIIGEEIRFEEKIWGCWKEGYGYVKFFRGGDYSFAYYFIEGKLYLRDGNKKAEITTLEDIERIIPQQVEEWANI